MDPKGIIFAAIDTNADEIETWNRWYDLEHLPPNIALPQIMSGRRYVAPPRLHAARLPTVPADGFEAGKGVNVTIYLTADDPVEAIGAMTEYRDVLEAEGRMVNAGNRVVRAGDAMHLRWSKVDPAIGGVDAEALHVGHNALRVVWRRGHDGGETARTAALAVDGVHAVSTLEAVFQAGLTCDLYYLEGDSIEVTRNIREAAPYADEADVILDAPFDVVVPFFYPWAHEIRGSAMPQTIA